MVGSGPLLPPIAAVVYVCVIPRSRDQMMSIKRESGFQKIMET